MHEAANLPPMDINGLADAYVLVKLKSRSDSTCEIIHKSELKLKTLSPVWNENLEKYIRAKEDFRIIFEGEISFKFDKPRRTRKSDNDLTRTERPLHLRYAPASPGVN